MKIITTASGNEHLFGFIPHSRYNVTARDPEPRDLLFGHNNEVERDRLLSSYANAGRKPFPVGVYEFRKVRVTGQWMFLTDAGYTTAFNLLPGMGWLKQHVERVSRNYPDTCKLITRELDPGRRYILLSTPGAYTSKAGSGQYKSKASTLNLNPPPPPFEAGTIRRSNRVITLNAP